MDWQQSSAIKQGADVVNQVGVECQGSSLRFYANGTLLVEIEDESFTNGQIGVVAASFKDGGGVHVVFDDVVVYELD
jgi:hypothetical protein